VKDFRDAHADPPETPSASAPDGWRKTIGRGLALLSWLIFVTSGFGIAIFLHLSAPLEFGVVIIAPAIVAALAAYIMRPERFRKGMRRR